MKGYIRDKRSPIPSNPNVSRVMSSNRSKGTLPEMKLRRALRDAGLPGYRLHRKDVPGRPDIAYVGRKVAIFINGCFWHRCPRCDLPIPKSNTDFWKDKFEMNVKRDNIKKGLLESNGWKVLVIWECEIKQDINDVVSRIISIISVRTK
jgi:DNA mismatch endonuclease (patch repair protein)